MKYKIIKIETTDIPVLVEDYNGVQFVVKMDLLRFVNEVINARIENIDLKPATRDSRLIPVIDISHEK